MTNETASDLSYADTLWKAADALRGQVDARTADGSDMSHYDERLRKALLSIESTFQKRAATGLLSERGTLLPTSDETPVTDGTEFDRVTWLVIMENSE